MKRKDGLKASIVKALAPKYGCTQAFVYMSINGEKDSDTAQEIKKEFGKRYAAAKEIINQKL